MLSSHRRGIALAAATAVVGLCVFAFYATVVSDDPSATPLDRGLLGVADDLRTQVAVDLVNVITALGSPVTVAVLVLWVGELLLVRGHVEHAVALVAGAVLLFVAVRLAKEGIDRPRPPRPLVSADGASFPSAHAAYSTVWVAAAMALASSVPGIGRRSLLVGVALLIAVCVGLSRIYLRVHYWSDVAGGWGLGAAILGACALAALGVGTIRQNGRGQAPSGPSAS